MAAGSPDAGHAGQLANWVETPELMDEAIPRIRANGDGALAVKLAQTSPACRKPSGPRGRGWRTAVAYGSCLAMRATLIGWWISPLGSASSITSISN